MFLPTKAGLKTCWHTTSLSQRVEVVLQMVKHSCRLGSPKSARLEAKNCWRQLLKESANKGRRVGIKRGLRCKECRRVRAVGEVRPR